MRYSSSESNILSRRYELQTCLLEVWTERSPLSDWQSQIVSQNLRFRLQLAHGKKIIKVNQQQIINLIEAVTIYCDRWLAQDDLDTLDHAIAVPKLSKLKLSTLQLFDLYESLELCANEFVILPNVVLEVRRLNPNWLKIVAAAIAIIGVSIGTIRLVSHEQPSYQIASSPNDFSPEKASIPPSANSESKTESSPESSSKVAPSPKSSNQPNLSISESKPNSAPLPSSQDLNREAKSRERTEKDAIAPESRNPNINQNNINSNSDRQRITDNRPSVSDRITSGSSASPQQSRRLESPNKDASPTAPVIAEAAKPSPSAPSAKISVPSAASRSVDADTTTNIKVLQIQSELPSDITTSLARYIQTLRIATSATGAIALDLQISGDRIVNISIDNQGSTLKDSKAIAELESLILKWRSANPVTGKIHLVVQL